MYILRHGVLVHGQGMHQLHIVVQFRARKLCARPRDKGRVTVFTENIGMNVLLRNVKVAGKSETQTRGIQRGAGADDLVFRDAGDFHEHVGDDVHRIADDVYSAFGAAFAMFGAMLLMMSTFVCVNSRRD